MTALLSPVTGRPLRPDSAHSLTDGEARWPVLDRIPFLRTGREALVAEALQRLDAGDADGALAAVLADQDDWWRGPTATPDDLRALVRDRDSLSLREAMALLRWGPVADYFAHRWSDPTFLAGLALVESHWNDPASAFELACGIGHHLRALGGRGVRATGGDVVFAKLWVARHWVAPDASLVCFDAASPWPVSGSTAAPGGFDLVSCHDAFYFLEPKAEILARLRSLLSPRGLLLIGHVHNRDWPNLSAGSAMTADQLAAMFADAALFDDAEMTSALLEARAPRAAAGAEALRGVEAFTLAEGPGRPAVPRPVLGGLAVPPDGAALRRNPLYDADGRLQWPSERYGREYGPRASYPVRAEAPATAVMDAASAPLARRRELLHLPERW